MQSSSSPHERLIQSIGNQDIEQVRESINALGGDKHLNEIDINYGITPLMYASTIGNIEIIKLLLERGADVNLVNEEQTNALMLAHDNIVAKLLLDNGADPNVASDGYTVLMSADLELCELLIQYGATVNYQNSTGTTALHAHAFNGSIDCVKLLVEHGADVNRRNMVGFTPLMLAVTNGSIDVIKYLLGKVDVNSRDLAGSTALIIAAANGRTDSMVCLLENNADVNLVNKQGKSALIQAAELDFEECIELLLKYNADTTIVDQSGRNFDAYRIEHQPSDDYLNMQNDEHHHDHDHDHGHTCNCSHNSDIIQKAMNWKL
jgi:ankyrin repeat protein